MIHLKKRGLSKIDKREKLRIPKKKDFFELKKRDCKRGKGGRQLGSTTARTIG